MNEDAIEYSLESSSYLESLTNSRKNLKDSSLLAKLDEVIELELELALLAAHKAKSCYIKAEAKLIPLKGV